MAETVLFLFVCKSLHASIIASDLRTRKRRGVYSLLARRKRQSAG